MQNIINKISDRVNISDLTFLDLIFILSATAFGALIFILPIYYVLGILLVLLALFFSIIKPNYCFFLIIFTIPFADITWHIGGSPVAIALHDIAIIVCIFSVFINILARDEKPNLSTRLDLWLIILAILYLYAGINTTNLNKGILVSAKFIEALCVYFLTVYFIRTNKATMSSMIKTLVFTGLFQAALGLLQTATGKFGCNYRSERGYLGYFGLGSNNVFHSTGTFGHFATLGHYLLTILVFYLPVYYFISTKKISHKLIIGIMLFALITSYSRGALSAFILAFIYFLYHVVKDKKKFFIAIVTAALILLPISSYLGHSKYVNTLNPRNAIWDVHFAYIKHNLDHILFGNGLSSYEETIWQYLPRSEPLREYSNWTAHNIYLWYLEEMGIIGIMLYFSYLLFLFFDTLIRAKKKPKLLKTINLSLNLVLLIIFYGGINDHVYHEPFMIIFLMLLTGMVYAKNKKLPGKVYT